MDHGVYLKITEDGELGGVSFVCSSDAEQRTIETFLEQNLKDYVIHEDEPMKVKTKAPGWFNSLKNRTNWIKSVTLHFCNTMWAQK